MQFGSQINPAYGNVDWSNLVNAGRAEAAGMSALGKGLSSAVESIDDAIKRQKEQQKSDETTVKAGELILSALEKTAPNMFDNIAEEKMFLTDKETPLSKRASRAMAWLKALDSGMALQQEKRLQEDLQSRIDASNQPPIDQPIPNPYDSGYNPPSLDWLDSLNPDTQTPGLDGSVLPPIPMQ